jgi:hypothetical protein
VSVRDAITPPAASRNWTDVDATFPMKRPADLTGVAKMKSKLSEMSCADVVKIDDDRTLGAELTLASVTKLAPNPPGAQVPDDVHGEAISLHDRQALFGEFATGQASVARRQGIKSDRRGRPCGDHERGMVEILRRLRSARRRAEERHQHGEEHGYGESSEASGHSHFLSAVITMSPR